MLVSVVALVGMALAPAPVMATLPLAAQFVASMLTTIPAALLMEQIGRKRGFMLATLFGMAGGGLACVAILHGHFWLFVAGGVLVGVFNGFGSYYRFAAADAVDETHKSRAVSYILAGGVVAAVVGPNMANLTKSLIASAPFAGCYASLVGFYILSLATLSALELPTTATQVASDSSAAPRPLREIAAQPQFIVALVCGTLGYGVMSLVMTATPLAMQHHSHPFEDTSFVIQWHILGMFAPSFVTGHLLLRFGRLKMMFAGGLLGLACVATNLVGSSVAHFWTALVCLGISWNFLFIGATTLLTETYRPSERARTQAANDFAVFTTIALAALSAGGLQHHFGWRAVNLGVLPLLAIILASIVWLALKNRVARSTEALTGEPVRF